MLRPFLSFHSVSTSLLHCKTVESVSMHILKNYVDNMHNRMHIFKENAFNMHICLIKTEKAAERTVKFSSSSFICTYFEDFFKKYVEYRAYFGDFSRKYAICNSSLYIAQRLFYQRYCNLLSVSQTPNRYHIYTVFSLICKLPPRKNHQKSWFFKFTSFSTLVISLNQRL